MTTANRPVTELTQMLASQGGEARLRYYVLWQPDAIVLRLLSQPRSASRNYDATSKSNECPKHDVMVQPK